MIQFLFCISWLQCENDSFTNIWADLLCVKKKDPVSKIYSIDTFIIKTDKMTIMIIKWPE